MAAFRINLVRQQWQTVAASRPSGQAGEQFGKIVLTADTQRRVVHFAHYQAVRKLFFPAFVEEALAQYLRRVCDIQRCAVNDKQPFFHSELLNLKEGIEQEIVEHIAGRKVYLLNECA